MFKLCSQIWPNPGKGTIRTPLPETPPCRHVAPQRVGQLAPGATRGEHMQNGFQSLPVIRRKTSPQPWPYQEEWPNIFPLCVGEPIYCRYCVMPRDAGPIEVSKRHCTGHSTYRMGKTMRPAGDKMEHQHHESPDYAGQATAQIVPSTSISIVCPGTRCRNRSPDCPPCSNSAR